jgi:hypothetical protein
VTKFYAARVKRLGHELREGTWFKVAVTEGHAVSLVARWNTRDGFAFGYFFVIAEGASLEALNPSDSVLAARFSDRAIRSGVWPRLGRSSDWNPDFWPVPRFARYAESRDQHIAVEYRDDLITAVRESVISEAEAATLPSDDVLPDHFVASRLERLMAGASDAAPSE